MLLKTWELVLKICFKAAIGAEYNNLLSFMCVQRVLLYAESVPAEAIPYVP